MKVEINDALVETIFIEELKEQVTKFYSNSGDFKSSLSYSVISFNYNGISSINI